MKVLIVGPTHLIAGQKHGDGVVVIHVDIELPKSVRTRPLLIHTDFFVIDVCAVIWR